MKKILFIILPLVIVLTSCKDDDVNLFDKSADERAAEAIAALKQDLIANPWKIKYKPEDGSGSFWVLLNFSGNNKVTIQSDLGANNGEFYEQTITYRIDNSLGLELIIESYSMFSFLFEQFQATFGAEYEFNYANKTPDNDLVFTSKTDLGTPTILLFQKAVASDEALLGTTLSGNLYTLANDLDKFSSSLKLTYVNKNLMFFLSLDEITRNITITSVTRKTNTSVLEQVNFTAGYLIQGDSMIFDSALTGTFFGNNINVKSIKFSTLTENSFNGCNEPIPLHLLNGITSASDNVTLETTLADLSGRTFVQESDFFVCPLQYIFDNGRSVAAEVTENISGALAMQLYYNYDIGEPFYALGFVIRNLDESTTFALREFTPVLNENHIQFNFAPEISIFGNPQTDANIENINIYLETLTEGDNTYVFKLNEGVFEFHNPCTGWSFVFLSVN